MKYIELQEAFEIELNLFDDGMNKPASMDTEWWLNRALEKFYKTRYSGNNYSLTGFELNQKRIDDLRTLVTTVEYDTTRVSKTENTVELPDDYIVLLGDTAGIVPAEGVTNNCWEIDDNYNYETKYFDTLESTIETIDRQVNNPLSEHILKYNQARPLKLVQGNTVRLINDGNYEVKKYKLTYLRKPKKINIHLHPFEEYTDMPEHTHYEIVKMAAQMYIENKKDPRLNSHNAEVREME